MIIDMHTHPFGNPTFSYGDAVKTRRDVINLRRQKPDLFRARYINARELTDLLVEDMDIGGIDRTVIQPGFREDPIEVYEAVKKHPDRLVGLFNIGHEGSKHPADSDIYQDIDWKKTREEIDHYVKKLDLRGCGEVMLTRFTRESAPEKIARDLRPLMEALSDHKVPVMFLTGWTQFSTPLYHGMPLFVDLLAEWFPEVPIVITKMGRSYSFIFEMALAVAYKHYNVFIDVVQADPSHIERAVSELGPDRIMFGTDWAPTWRAEAGDIYKKNLKKMADLKISPEAREWIMWKTSAGLFKINPSQAKANSPH